MAADFVMAEKAIATAQPEETLPELAVREHARLVYRIAYSVLRNPTEAEDAVQDTFLRMLRYGDKASRIRDQKAWLARIAWRVAVDRRAKLVQSAARSDQSTDGVASRSEGADHILVEQERREALDRIIAALPDSLRDPLVLATVEDLSPREVAETLGISEAAVRSRAFRARQILQQRMKAWMGDRQWENGYDR